MALLKSLEICGIRNFSPDQKETVYFNTPVVLFQGPNGSGKTTILESIRYSLTGELPAGTSAGQGFVNEPKISNRNLTKGSIKIKFIDAEGNIVTIARIVQVQRDSGDNLKFKKLDYSVRLRDKNNPTDVIDISGRCVDVDAYCCTALNVSKSIFNNVLFCHQENSLWPLDEPKKLKEKFDEIFDAAKYNKCIESIRQTIKQMQVHYKFLQVTVDSKMDKKVTVDRHRAKLEEKKEKFKEVNTCLEQKNSELKPLEDRMREILALQESLGALEKQLTGKEEEKKGLISQQQTLRDSITFIFDGSDEELEAKISTFKDEHSSEELVIRQLENKVKDINQQLQSVNLKVQKKQIDIGQMKEEHNQYKKKLDESKVLTDKLRSELDVEDFGDNDILLGELANVLKSQEDKFSDLMKEKDVEEQELQKQIDKLREINAKTDQLIISKNTSIREYQNKLKDIQYKLEELDTSDSQLKTVTDKIHNLEITLENLKKSFDEKEKMAEIEELKDQINTKEQYLEKLDRENRILQRNYAAEQKIESEKTLIIEKQGQIKKIKVKHSNNLNKLFNDEIPENNLRKAVLNIQNVQDGVYKTHANSVNKLEKQLTTLDTTLRHVKEQLKTSQNDLSTNKRKISEVCKGRDFTTVLEESYKKKEKLQRDKGQYTAGKIMYETFIGKFENLHSCPICKTDFKQNQAAMSMIIKELTGKIKNIPSDLLRTETDLKNEEKFYDNLQQLIAVNDDIQTLTNKKIPELTKEVTTLTEQVDEKTIELADEKESIKGPQELIEICKNLITDATLIDQYNADISRAKSNITDLEENIEKVPSNRTKQETEMEIDSVKRELSNTKNKYETSKTWLERQRERIQDHNKKIQTEVQKQIDIQKLVQEKPLLEKQQTEYSDQLLVLKTEIEELKINLSSQKQELEEATEKKTKVTKTNSEIKDKNRKKLVALQNALTDIHKLQKNIKEYERKKNNEKLEKAIEELAEFKINLEKLESNKKETLESIMEKKESIAKKDSQFRALKDNVTLRQKNKQEGQVSSEIIKIKEKIGGYNQRQLFDEKQKKTIEIHKKQREINILMGQMEEIQTQIDDLEDELKKPEHKNAYNDYKKAYYELKIHILATEDLNKYVTVLERSVLKFHEERMVQINKMIRTLWRTIYRGNDIDYIEIMTDENTTGGKGKRRNYNYKVVQVKNGIELDMRGRCSAGQKVLACLVIRMALAETFSSHCGILALDEPTTNLDKENISSLCDALSELINSRVDQSNFQLLIITHDEEFLRNLTQVQNLDSYWQVKRNRDGSSIVEKQML